MEQILSKRQELLLGGRMKITIYFVIVQVVFVNNIVSVFKLRTSKDTLLWQIQKLYHIEISKDEFNVLKAGNWKIKDSKVIDIKT